MSQQSNRRPGQSQPKKQRQPPLFEQALDDVELPRIGPPAPLGDLLADLDEAMPARAAPPPRAPRPRPASPDHNAILPRPPRPTSRDDAEEAAEELMTARRAYAESRADLRRVRSLLAEPYVWSSARRAPAPFVLPHRAIVIGLVLIVSIMVLLTLGRGGGLTQYSRWAPASLPGAAAENSLARLFAPAQPAGDYTLKAPPSITAAQIDRILGAYRSPATGTGQLWYELGRKYGIDPAFAVAFFIHESSAGTNPQWAGMKPDGSTTHNVGNIICAGYSRCYGRFRDYPSWEAGIEDWYRLIDVEYIQGRGHRTVADIIPVYAPAFENDVQGYVNVVHRLVDGWRTNGVP